MDSWVEALYGLGDILSILLFFFFTNYLCVCLLSFIYRSETMTSHYAPFEANTQRAPKEPD